MSADLTPYHSTGCIIAEMVGMQFLGMAPMPMRAVASAAAPWLLFACSSAEDDGNVGKAEGNTDRLENLTFETSDGDELSLSQLSDEGADVILVYATAAWCFSCREEFAWLNERPELADGSLAVVAVVLEGGNPGVKAEAEDIAAMSAAYEPLYPLVLDPHNEFAPYRTGAAIPVNIVIDVATREIVHQREGFNADALQAAIASGLASAEGNQ